MSDEMRAREIVATWLRLHGTDWRAPLVDAIRLALSSARAEGFRAGIERAAQVAETLDFISGDVNDWRDDCAEAIRALSDGASHDHT